MFANEKCSSLFDFFISDEEKRVYDIDSWSYGEPSRIWICTAVFVGTMEEGGRDPPVPGIYIQVTTTGKPRALQGALKGAFKGAFKGALIVL